MHPVILRQETPLVGQLACPDPTAAQLAQEFCSFYVAGYRFDWRFKAHRWDGKEYLYDLQSNRFPAGLIPSLADYLRGKGFSVEVKGWPGGKTLAGLGVVGSVLADGTKLRPYQEEAVATALVAGRGIAWMGTGTGKTEVIAGMLYSTKARKKRALVIVPSKGLLHQTAKRLQTRLGEGIGVVGDGYTEWRRVTVATYQTLFSQRETLEEDLAGVEIVISDEAHHVQAETWLEVLALTAGAPYRFGTTATPWTGKGEDMLLEGFAGPVCYKYSSKEAIRDGYLVPPRVYICRYPNLLKLNPAERDWRTIYQQGIVDNPLRNETVAQMSTAAASEWGKTLVVVSRVSHGEELTSRIRGFGTKVDFLSGKDSTSARNRLLRQLEGSKLDCLVATNLLDEGVDVPMLSAVSLAAGGKAEYKVVQRVGRVMRLGGQASALVLDWHDTAHGVLIKHSRDRRKLYTQEGWPVEEISA